MGYWKQYVVHAKEHQTTGVHVDLNAHSTPERELIQWDDPDPPIDVLANYTRHEFDVLAEYIERDSWNAAGLITMVGSNLNFVPFLSNIDIVEQQKPYSL